MAPADNTEKDHYEYYCGPRAKVEIKESNLIAFIQTVRTQYWQKISFFSLGRSITKFEITLQIYGSESLENLSKQIERASGTEIGE
jgi:hypothetical protein